MHQTHLKFLLAFLVAIAAAFGFLLALRSRPVLYRYYEIGDPLREPALAIFNPLRDREPERTAEEFLARLKTVSCAEMIRELSASREFQQQTCSQEKIYPLTSLNLRNRTDEPSKVRLYFTTRYTHSDLEGPLWVTLESNGPTWRVTNYERWY